jgi:hypothetical protein
MRSVAVDRRLAEFDWGFLYRGFLVWLGAPPPVEHATQRSERRLISRCSGMLGRTASPSFRSTPNCVTSPGATAHFRLCATFRLMQRSKLHRNALFDHRIGAGK